MTCATNLPKALDTLDTNRDSVTRNAGHHDARGAKVKLTRTTTKRTKRTTRRTTREAWMVLKDRITLATLMAIHKVTQRELAEAAGWKSHGHVGNLLRGTKSTVTPPSAFRIAERLGVRTEDLFVPRVTKKTSQPVRKQHAA